MVGVMEFGSEGLGFFLGSSWSIVDSVRFQLWEEFERRLLWVMCWSIDSFRYLSMRSSGFEEPYTACMDDGRD